MVDCAREIVPLFDESTLNRLRELLDEADLREVFDRVPAESAECLNAIRAAVVARNLTAAGRAAHALTGMAANFGARRLAAAAGDIARGLPTIEAIADRLPSLDQVHEETCKGIHAMNSNRRNRR